MSTRDEMAEVFLPGIEALGGGSGRTATASGILSDLVASVRPRQWTKNVLVFVAPAAAGVLGHRADLLHTLATFGIFCAAASGVYLVNDVTDAGADRNHPVKCHRPIARGAVSARIAVAIALGLIGGALAASWFVARQDLVVLIAVYLVISFAYTFRLKREPVIELAAVASGFLLRALAGGVATHIPLSSWFVAVASFGALFVVVGKRLGEYLRLGENAGQHRCVLEVYTASFLRSALTLTASVTVTAYCLWAFDKAGLLSHAAHHYVWIQLSVIPIIVGVLHILRLVDSGLVDAPEELVFHDHLLQGLGALWIGLFAIGIYGVSPQRLLTGWGRTAPSASLVVAPVDLGALTRLLVNGDGAPSAMVAPPMIARGLGRSYGDAAQCAAGVVIDTSRLDGIGAIHPQTGAVEVGGGVSLDALIRDAIPSGWFIPVSPGTRQVTVGGAIAADVHGKNHHHHGSFCRHVASLTLVTPVGIRTIDRESDPELFWATAGGMGLTGVVAAATLRLRRVDTTWVEVDTERFGDLDGVMSTMQATDHLYPYSVAWVDCNPHHGGLGRSVMTRGDHAPADALTPRLREKPLALPGTSRLRLPFRPPISLVGRSTARAFNELWFRKAPRREFGALVPLTTFLHPLDAVADWNLLYGPSGFVQYEFVVPPDQGEVVRTAISMMATSRVPSMMAVLKRFGRGDPGLLSFPMEGWTLALDFPLGPPGLSGLLDRLDELVAGAGGRVYLAKDARLRPELVDLMYPRIGELAAVRREVDPRGILRSDLSRRLGLDRQDCPR